ncbi:hypothetical protein KR074_006174, partial [Drosophila pseudoananassae]
LNKYPQIVVLVALLGIHALEAVVVAGGGGGHQQLHNNNRNGYRYNGPAHKYLPVEQPEHHQEHQDHQQNGYNGPYSSQHYQEQRQQQPHGGKDQTWQPVFSQGVSQGHQISGGQKPHHQTQDGHQIGGKQHQQHNHNNEPSYEPLASHHFGGESWNSHQEQHGSQKGESWNSQSGHQGHQKVESWPSNQVQYETQRGESWQSHQGHQGSQRGDHNHGQDNQYRGDLWQPIREHDLEKLPSAEAHATSHKTFANPGKNSKLVPAYTLSSDAEHDRFIGLDSLDTRLLSQSLPDAYRKVPFTSPSGPPSQRHEQQLGGSTFSGYLQMQSHSYQLPSTQTTHREYPQEQQHSGNRQYSANAYAVSPSYLHGSQSLNPSAQFHLSHPSREFQPPYY